MKACKISHVVRLPCVFIISKYHPRISTERSRIARLTIEAHTVIIKRNHGSLIGETFLLCPLFGPAGDVTVLPQPCCGQLPLFPTCRKDNRYYASIEILMYFDSVLFVREGPLEYELPWFHKNGIAAVACRTTSKLPKLVGVRINCSRWWKFVHCNGWTVLICQRFLWMKPILTSCHSAGQKSRVLLYSGQIHCRDYDGLPLVHIACQMNPVHIVPTWSVAILPVYA